MSKMKPLNNRNKHASLRKETAFSLRSFLLAAKDAMKYINYVIAPPLKTEKLRILFNFGNSFTHLVQQGPKTLNSNQKKHQAQKPPNSIRESANIPYKKGHQQLTKSNPKNATL
eukprot:c53654_g1_i1 orf=99-440(-)